MDDDEGRVKELLEQCVDHAALRLSTGPSDALDADLLARLQRLKAPPVASSLPPSTRVNADGLHSDLAERLNALKKDPTKDPSKHDPLKVPHLSLDSNPPPRVHLDADGLQSDLGGRFDALKKDSSKQGPLKGLVPEIIETVKVSDSNRAVKDMHQGDALEVEKLLKSVQDCIRLEKSGCHKSNHNVDSDEDISDSEVDHVVEWAKDAAVLEEDEEDEASDADHATIPTVAHSPQKKKKGSRWKFW